LPIPSNSSTFAPDFSKRKLIKTYGVSRSLEACSEKESDKRKEAKEN